MTLAHLHHASLNLFSEFLEALSEGYAKDQERITDPQHQKLERWIFTRIARDTNFYHELSHVGMELCGTMESLLEVISALRDEHEAREFSQKLALLEAEIRGCGRHIKLQADALVQGIDRRLQMLSMSRDISQSNNVQTLTLLATIFLPLSLAAGVLSMQTRFKNLGALLYDFFGVVVLLAATVAVILLGIFIHSMIQEYKGKHHHRRWYKFVSRLAVATTASIFLILGALILASFLVGMFKDVSLGARILGYGLAAIFGIILVFGIGVYILSERL